MKLAWFYFIPVYFNLDTLEIKGRNKFYDILLSIMIKIHCVLIFITSFILDIEWTFQIKIEEENK